MGVLEKFMQLSEPARLDLISNGPEPSTQRAWVGLGLAENQHASAAVPAKYWERHQCLLSREPVP